MMRRVAALLIVALVACGGDSGPLFNEPAVDAAIESSGKFETDAEKSSALDTFRYICETIDISINRFSVYDLLVNETEYGPEFIAAAKLGCPDKFVAVKKKIERGDCFGGPLSCPDG